MAEPLLNLAAVLLDEAAAAGYGTRRNEKLRAAAATLARWKAERGHMAPAEEALRMADLAERLYLMLPGH